jgi:hypothetical protein
MIIDLRCGIDNNACIKASLCPCKEHSTGKGVLQGCNSHQDFANPIQVQVLNILSKLHFLVHFHCLIFVKLFCRSGRHQGVSLCHPSNQSDKS